MISKRDMDVAPDFSKRYWVAEIAQYYPCGFLEDVEYTCDTLEELEGLLKEEESYEKQLFWDSKELKYMYVKEVA